MGIGMQINCTEEQTKTRKSLTNMLSAQEQKRCRSLEEKRRVDKETSQKISEILQSDPEPYDKPANCISWALGLDNSISYEAIAKSYSDSHTPVRLKKNKTCPYQASPWFLTWLLSKKILEEDSAHENALIIYCDKERHCTHAGLVTRDGRVKSKWGELPGIHVHEIWQVPESYGEKIKYYRLPKIHDIEDSFKEFCEYLTSKMKPGISSSSSHMDTSQDI
jgi:hypothetical protein